MTSETKEYTVEYKPTRTNEWIDARELFDSKEDAEEAAKKYRKIMPKSEWRVVEL